MNTIIMIEQLAGGLLYKEPFEVVSLAQWKIICQCCERVDWCINRKVFVALI